MGTASFLERLISPLTLVWTAAAAGMWYLWPELGVLPLVLALGPWFLRLLVQDRLAYATPYDWALGLFLLTAALSVWAAYDRAAALTKFWPIVAGVLLFYAFSNWQFDDERAGGKLGWLMALYGAGMSVYFLAVNDWVVYPGKAPALARLGMALQRPFGEALPVSDWHPNIVGGILAMTAPFAGMAVWRSWRKRQWPGLAAAVGLLVVVLFGLLMSSSRGAWLALAAATGLAIWWQLLDRLASGRQTKRRRLFVGSVVGGLAVVVALLLAWPGLAGRTLALLSAVGGLQRAVLYQGALTLVRDYPVVGGGLDLFQMLHASYVMLLHVGFTAHSHNLYLDVAIEQGLPGLFALLWMWGIFVLVLWQATKLQKRRVRRSDPALAAEAAGLAETPAGAPAIDPASADVLTSITDDEDTPNEKQRRVGHRGRSSSQAGVLGAAAMSLTTIALHGLVDDALYGSRAVMLLFLPLAFTVGRVARWRAAAQAEAGAFEQGKLSSLRWANAVAGGGLAIVLALAVLLPASRSYFWSNLGAIRQSRTELAVYSWPEWPIQDELRRKLDMEPAVAAYERALALNPANTAANRRLGMIELSVGEYEEALSHLQEAYLGAQWDNATRQLLGEAMIVNGRVTGGAELWQTVNNVQGQLENRRFWYEHIGDVERLTWVEEALGQLAVSEKGETRGE